MGLNILNEKERQNFRMVAFMLAKKDDNFGPFAFYEVLKDQYFNDELDHEQLKMLGMNRIELDIRPSERKILSKCS